MRAGFPVAGMTTRTIRLVLRCCPGDRLRVACMARCTGQVTAVVARISPRVMTEVDRDPACGVVTVVALQAGDKMISGLAGSSRTVVALRATARRYAVMVKAGRNPGAC